MTKVGIETNNLLRKNRKIFRVIFIVGYILIAASIAMEISSYALCMPTLSIISSLIKIIIWLSIGLFLVLLFAPKNGSVAISQLSRDLAFHAGVLLIVVAAVVGFSLFGFLTVDRCGNKLNVSGSI